MGSAVPGNTMNLALSIALYASLCRAQGLPLLSRVSNKRRAAGYTDAGLLAEATLWASMAKTAENQAFNVNNGDIWRWSELWRARWFEVRCAPPIRLSFRPTLRGQPGNVAQTCGQWAGGSGSFTFERRSVCRLLCLAGITTCLVMAVNYGGRAFRACRLPTRCFTRCCTAEGCTYYP